MFEKKCEKCGKKFLEKGDWYLKNREKNIGEDNFVRPLGEICGSCFDRLEEDEQKRWTYFSRSRQINTR